MARISIDEERLNAGVEGASSLIGFIVSPCCRVMQLRSERIGRAAFASEFTPHISPSAFLYKTLRWREMPETVSFHF
jgi:hypothetical protein